MFANYSSAARNVHFLLINKNYKKATLLWTSVWHH